MQIHELTALARQMKASDIHISQGLPLMFRIDGIAAWKRPCSIDDDATRALIESMLDEAHREALDTAPAGRGLCHRRAGRHPQPCERVLPAGQNFSDAASFKR